LALLAIAGVAAGVAWLVLAAARAETAVEAFDPAESPLCAEAARLAEAEPLGALVLVASAHHLPHGGTDRVVVCLRPEGGTVERLRAPERSAPTRALRSLSKEQSEDARRELARRCIWDIGDQLEPVRDGLVATIAMTQSGRVRSLQLHCGNRAGEVAELLRFMTELAGPLSGDV
jgi:hypothetical protein